MIGILEIIKPCKLFVLDRNMIYKCAKISYQTTTQRIKIFTYKVCDFLTSTNRIIVGSKKKKKKEKKLQNKVVVKIN